MTKTVKATRKLSDFNFDYEGAAVALVGPSVGGAANGRTTLLTKSLKDITEEQVEKATEVQVTMNIVDFLCKFYHLWYDDAIVLATAMGFDVGDAGYSFVESAEASEAYLQEQVDAIHIMKALVIDKELDEIKKAVGELSAKDYLIILKAQEQFEQNFEAALEKAEAFKKSSPAKAEGVTALKGVISPSVDNKKEEDSMSEFVSKAAYEAAIQKAVEDAVKEKDVQLAKAAEEIENFKAEKEEAVTKSRKSAIGDVEKDAAAAEELFKSLQALTDEAFSVVIKNLKKKEEKLEESDLLKEVGGKGQEVVPEKPQGVDKTADLLKAQFQKEGAK